MVHDFVACLHDASRPGGPQRLRAGGGGATSKVTDKCMDCLHQICILQAHQRLRVAHKIKSGPRMGGVATSPVLSRGPATLGTKREY